MLIKNETYGLSNDIFFAGDNEEFVFDVDGETVKVSHYNIFGAVKKLIKANPQSNISWKGKEEKDE